MLALTVRGGLAVLESSALHFFDHDRGQRGPQPAITRTSGAVPELRSTFGSIISIVHIEAS